MAGLKIGFLASFRFENEAVVRGAVLVTDEHTKPVEFRVTSPVRPTSFQRTLYGDVLQEHILVELVGVPLLSALKESPSVVIVRDPLFLGVNSKQDIPVVRLYREDEVSAGGDSNPEPLHAAGGKYDPVFMETSRQNEGLLPEIRKSLAEVFGQRNLLEPFDRIKTACQQVHEQKVGESAT